jgi:hypothetical protein
MKQANLPSLSDSAPYDRGRSSFSRIRWKDAAATIAQPLGAHTHIVPLVFVLGLALRFAAVRYALSISLPLDADSEGYMRAADDILRLTYVKDIPREPLFPLVAALSFLIFGSSTGVLRMTTAFLGSLVILPSCKLGESVKSRTAGVFVATMIALNPFLHALLIAEYESRAHDLRESITRSFKHTICIDRFNGVRRVCNCSGIS